MTSKAIGAALGILTLGLAALTGGGCVRVIPGVQLSLALELAQPDGITPGGTAIYRSPEGGEIHIASGHLNIGAWEVLPCATAHLSWPSFSSVAQAHTQNTPTRWGTPQAINLTPEGEEQITLGTIEPPPGRWCSLILYLSPADGDGLGLPETVDMTGQTLHLKGSYGGAGSGDSKPLEILTNTSNLIVLALGQDGLTFDEAQPWGAVTLRLDPGQLFSDLDGQESSEALQHLVEQNLTRLVTLSEAQTMSPDAHPPYNPAP